MMEIKIRKATDQDFNNVLLLSKEFAAFQGAEEKFINTEALMRREQDYFNCYLAENHQKEVIGFATYFVAYYTWVGKSLYLDDLYVKEAYRGLKVGSSLLSKIFEIARQEDCKRVRWLVSSWNESAIDFYQKCGASISKEDYVCDFDQKGIAEFKLK